MKKPVDSIDYTLLGRLLWSSASVVSGDSHYIDAQIISNVIGCGIHPLFWSTARVVTKIVRTAR